MLKKIGKWNLLIIAVVLGLILSLLNFFVINPSKEYVSASFNLLYSGAEKGEAPNGQPYSVDVIRSEVVLADREIADKRQCRGFSDRPLKPGDLARKPRHAFQQCLHFFRIHARSPPSVPSRIAPRPGSLLLPSAGTLSFFRRLLSRDHAPAGASVYNAAPLRI